MFKPLSCVVFCVGYMRWERQAPSVVCVSYGGILLAPSVVGGGGLWRGVVGTRVPFLCYRPPELHARRFLRV